MSATAERWYEEVEAEDEAARAARRLEAVPSERAKPSRDGASRPPGEAAPRQADEPRWNVLAEELVSYPTPAQRIWLEPSPGSATTSSSRAYADAWLQRELDELRRRRETALAGRQGRARDVRTTPSVPFGDEIHGGFVGDPSTVSRSLRTPRRTPATSVPHRRARAGEAVATLPGTRVAHFGPRGLRRLLPGAATLAVLVGSWFGIGALAASAHAVQVERLPGSVSVPGGYVYVVRPGDTLWSIAARVEPTADPRPLVDRLQAELGGNTLQPGDRLLLPRGSR
jgi:hypothetical protein